MLAAPEPGRSAQAFSPIPLVRQKTRPPEQVALGVTDAKTTQREEIVLGLDTFCDQVGAHASAEVDHGLAHRLLS